MKETLALPKEVIDERFGVRGREGVDIEIVGGTRGVNGGGFLYTNLDTVAVGVVLKLPKLAAQQRRPEEIIAGLKRHPAIAPLVEGAELKEYSAHLIPEAGSVDDAEDDRRRHARRRRRRGAVPGRRHLAGGRQLRDGQRHRRRARPPTRRSPAATRRPRGWPATSAGSSDTFVLRDHRKLRRAPHWC